MGEECLWEDEPLEWIIRNIGALEKAEGQAAAILREAYRRGLEGLERPKPEKSGIPPQALCSLSALAERAYSLGIFDAERRERNGYHRHSVGRCGPYIGPADDPADTVASRQAWR